RRGGRTMRGGRIRPLHGQPALPSRRSRPQGGRGQHAVRAGADGIPRGGEEERPAVRQLPRRGGVRPAPVPPRRRAVWGLTTEGAEQACPPRLTGTKGRMTALVEPYRSGGISRRTLGECTCVIAAEGRFTSRSALLFARELSAARGAGCSDFVFD